MSRSATVLRYAIGSIGTGGFGTLPGLVLVFYMTDMLGVPAWAAGIVVVVAKVCDVVVDPTIGGLSDRSLARTGSRRRIMTVGALAFPLLFVAMFAVPPALPPFASAAWVLAAFTLTAVAFSLFQVPYIALPAEITERYDDRTRLLEWRVVALSVAILLFGAVGPLLRQVGGPYTGYLVMAVVSGCVMSAAMLTSIPAAPRKSPASAHLADGGADRGPRSRGYQEAAETVRRSRPFRILLAVFSLQAVATGLMLAGANYVAVWVLHSEVALTALFVALIAPAIVCSPLWGRLARSIGKERALRFASVLFAVASLSLGAMVWAPGPWIYVPVALAGAAYAGMQALPLAMLPDVITHDAKTAGSGRAGVFGGVWTACETTGMAIGSALLTFVLAMTGYQEGTGGSVAAQPDAAVAGIAASFGVVPAALTAASLLFLVRYELRRSDIDGTNTHEVEDDVDVEDSAGRGTRPA